MFLGTHTPRLDDKGRLTLPAKFRDELAGGLMVTRSQDRSLAVYPREKFMELAAKANAASRRDPTIRAYVRKFFSGADEQRPDAQGRITIPVELRDYANLTKECVVSGSGEYIEIWDKAAWEAYDAETDENFSLGDSEALGGIL